MSQGHLLVAHERCRVDLLDERVIVAAHAATHLVLPLRGAVIVTFLHHEVDGRARVQVFGQVPEVVQHERVLRDKSAKQSVRSLRRVDEKELSVTGNVKTHVRHGQLLVESYVYFVGDRYAEREHSHKHRDLEENIHTHTLIHNDVIQNAFLGWG